jgi:hypothetical protein
VGTIALSFEVRTRRKDTYRRHVILRINHGVRALIGSLVPTKLFRACPRHTEIIHFGIRLQQLLIASRTSRDEPQVRPDPISLNNLSLDSLLSPAEELENHLLLHLSPSRALIPHHRNVVKAFRKDPAFRYCGRCCPRVHHPHAQESTSERGPKSTSF